MGLLTGLLAALFHALLDGADERRQQWYQRVDGSLLLPLLLCVLSAAAVLLALFLVRRFAFEASGSGIQRIEMTLKDHTRIRWQRILPVKFTGGLLAIGSGLVLGREGPTIHMGGALGTMLSGKGDHNRFQHHVLVAAGAAAGLAAAFNAPLAGLIFVTEEMRDQFRYTFHSLMAVLLASTTSVIVVQLLSGRQSDISHASFLAPSLAALPLFLLLGVFFGVFGVIFNRCLLAGVTLVKKQQGSIPYIPAVLAAVVITLTGVFFPVMTGSGHNALELALLDRFATRFMLVVFLARFVFSIFSYSIGVPGGIFAPMLALGTFFGLWYGQVASMFLPGLVEHPGIFVVGGMGALFAATVQAPITGIVLIVEMTRSYELILPLMVTCISASLVANRLGGKPVYSELARLS